MEAPLCFDPHLAFSSFEKLCQSKGLVLPTAVQPLTLSNYETQILYLSSLALDSRFASLIQATHRPIFIDIAARWVSSPSVEKNFIQSTNPTDPPIDGFYTFISIARAISITPEVLPLTHEIIKSTLIFQNFNTRYEQFGDRNILEFLLALHRLVSFDYDAFSSFISAEICEKLISHPWNSIKYLSIQLLAAYLTSSDKIRKQMVNKNIGQDVPVIGPYENSNEIDYLFLNTIEAKRISLERNLISEISAETTNTFEIPKKNLSPLVSNLAGILIAQSSSQSYDDSKFVPTTGAVSSIRKIATALHTSKPVLLTGEGGSGKTFYLEEAAKYFSKDDSIVRIHLGDQSDVKILVGTYSIGDKPGSFEWRPGILTVAVMEGRWVLIEDIDKAPTDVLSVLLPLLEKRELLIPSRGETVKAASQFQIFGTVRTVNKTNGAPIIPEIIGKRLWEQVDVTPPTLDELKLIIRNRFPILANFSEKFVDAYHTIIQTFAQAKFIALNKSTQNRPITSRDLIKWAHRVDLLLRENGVTDPNQPINSALYDHIFAEAVDCFTGFIPNFDASKYLISIIGECLEVPSHRVDLFVQNHIPVFTNSNTNVTIGRASLERKRLLSKAKQKQKAQQIANFADTNHALRLLEKIGVAVAMKEPTLLVGETGTGKTTVVQHLSALLNRDITVINVSQQTESSDLLGGYKPIDSKTIAMPLKELFDSIFESTFSSKKNEKFSALLTKCFSKSQWSNCVKLWREAIKLARTLLNPPEPEENAPKKRRKLSESDVADLQQKWNNFSEKIDKFEVQIKQSDKSFLFSFVEGSLVQAVRRGDWVLLDEVNLASPETLESIADLLAESPSITLSEKGDAESIKAHPDFRLFACMNPATDIGKRDLPTGLRSRFTELYVHSPDTNRNDLLSIIDKYIGHISITDAMVVNDVADLYLTAKQLSESNSIVDGANQRPHFSIRTLSRTLTYSAKIAPIYQLRRSLYEGFCMSFSTLLDKKSTEILLPIIEKYTIQKLKNAKSVMSQIPPHPKDDHEYIQFRHYWLKKGAFEPEEQPDYIITPYVEKNLMNLTRATAGGKFPVLIQGPTSSGKTSMINYLAKKTGHKFVRINNHEHTDLQEYLGSYVSNAEGKLAFQEGVLVQAVRNGYWIVLDELNLAPTDVLEALNRLLDDNRELFIPETQEIVRPHPDFMLFATQNPPGLYGGRKVLSRAFRNRFLELHFDDIPVTELEDILTRRCRIAPSYSKKIVEVYKQLSVNRQSTRVFEQKNSFATLRDLFRWAGREAIGYDQLAANGYMLLGERVRKKEERVIVKEVIEKVMRVKLDIDAIYQSFEPTEIINAASSVVWTQGMKKLAVLVSQALRYNEPILLVGETGCGKTTICQVLADAAGKSLHIVNAHQNTETGDIIGSQRPVRNRSEMLENLQQELQKLLNTTGTLDELREQYETADKSSFDEESIQHITDLENHLKILFEWSDGSLIQALKFGDFFLLDEISLADDSVLERLNSVLEPERTILLAEKGSKDSSITAVDGFQFFATMNPGGDYGKKELSPALRNRFTEIWVPSMENMDDVLQIITSKLEPALKPLGNVLVQFSEWFGQTYGAGDASSGVISLRDMLAWVGFANKLCDSIGNELSILHGASMVFIDSIGTNSTAALAETPELLKAKKLECVKKLSELLKTDLTSSYLEKFLVSVTDDKVSVGPFSLERTAAASKVSFNLQAPTTANNAMRVLRGMQVKKPMLLEGSPGVGKTSLITAIAEVTGHKLTRINLSEQTDLIDLFGSDSPAEGEGSNQFVWRDAPFLHAMQEGGWVLLDEMNLASQSVLEGLNACLDHRGETYIPELDRTFKCHPEFTVFAAQNPQYQGGGRKGLPKSFVNRFTVVYIDVLSTDDLKMISQYLYPNIPTDVINKMINFILELDTEVSVKRSFGHIGSPYEFNLRDTMRWLKLLTTQDPLSSNYGPEEFIDIIAKDRFRTQSDREFVEKIYTKHFGPFTKRSDFFQISEEYVQAGHSCIVRDSLREPTYPHVLPLQCNIQALETAITCVNNSWPLIIVGPTKSGKTNLIRYLAQVTGHELEEFAMNGDIDSMDLLGGFDQVDMNQKCSKLIQELIEICLNATCKFFGEFAATEVDPMFELLTYLKVVKISPETIDKISSTLPKVIELCPDYASQIAPLLEKINDVKEKLHIVNQARFEWFDGTLLQAVENGKWLVLDNANLCNPSVLDRLNSLLEPNGSLIVNECSLPSGEPRVVTPHKNFRLFLTMDSKYGELSRAMRNRGAELYLDSISTRATPFDRQLLQIEQPQTTEPLDSQLSSLSLKSSALPSSSFIKASDSFSRAFSLLEDSNLFSETMNSFLTSLELSLLPRNYAIFLKSWVSNILSLDYYTATERERISSFSSYVSLALKTPLQSTLDTIFGDNELPEPISKSQFFNPVINSYVSSKAKANKNGLTPSDVAVILYCIPLLNQIKLALEKCESNVHTLKPSSFTYLERAAAKHFEKPLKNPAKVDVYSMINVIYQFISSVVYQCMTSPVSDLTEPLFSLVLLLQIGVDLTALSSSKTTDESQLPVYRDILDDWYNKRGSAEIFATEDSKLKSAISEFGCQLDLTSGTSMKLIWSQCHEEVPSSLNSWTRYERVISVAQKFDSVSASLFSNSIDTIRSLQSAVIQTINAALKSDSENIELDDLIQKLESGIDTLQQQAANFEVQRKHYFDSGFVHISQIIELSSLLDPSIRKEAYRILGNISYNSKYSTYHLSKYERQNIQFPYAPLFDTLWKYEDGELTASAVDFVNNGIGQLLLSYTNKIDNVASQDRNQAILDFQTLTETVVSQSQYLVKDHLNQFSQLLYLTILQFVEVHSISITGLPTDVSALSSDVISQLFNNISQSENTNFVLAFEKYILKALKNLTDSSKVAAARAWIYFALGMLVLYVPNIPFDPAIHQHVAFDRSVAQKSLSEEVTSCWSYLKSIFVSPENSELEKCWENRIPQPFSEDAPTIYRPTASQIGAIYDEWNSLLAILPESLVLSLIDENNDVSLHLDQIKNLQRNTTQFILRMNSNFKQYSDITSLLNSFVYAMKLGLDIFASIDRSTSFKPYSLIDPTQILDSSKLLEIFSLIKNDVTKLPDDISNPLLLCLLETTNLMHKTRIESDKSIKTQSDLDEIIVFVFRSFYYKWSLTKMRDETAEAAKQSVFQDNSEQEVEDDFKRMFPDYEDVLSLEDSSKHTSEDIYSDLVQIYLQTFGEGSISISEVTLRNVKFLQEYCKTHAHQFVSDNLTNVLPVITTLLSNSIKGQDSSESLESPYDFYHSPRPEETVKFTTLALKVKAQIDKFLEIWPEHATLQHIAANCEEILALPLMSPIARYLVMVEQIYELLDGWEKSASKDYSVMAISQEVANAIVSVRKLELSSLPRLLDLEEVNAIKEMSMQWFTLFELLLGNTSQLDEDNEESTKLAASIVQNLTTFVSRSNYGQFDSRLKLLAAFSEHTNQLSEQYSVLAQVSESIKNVINFYEPLSKKVSAHIIDSRKALMKEVKDIVDLVRWKDTTVLALKQSIKKSHYKVHKVVRKYRDVLSASIEPIASAGLDQLPEADATALITLELTPTAAYNSITKHLELARMIPQWKSRSTHLSDVEQTANNMHRFILKVQAEELPDLEDFATEIISDMNRLRDATPKVLNEETKKEVSTLKMQKSNLLTTAIKELRRSGLKTTVRADIKERQALMTSIMSSVPSLTGAQIGKSNTYFYKIIDLVPRLRVAAISSESDAPQADIQRGLAISENILSLILQQRSTVATLLEGNESLETLLAALNSVAALLNGEDKIQSSHLLPIVQSSSLVVAWVPKLMSFAVDSCKSASFIGKISSVDTKVFQNISETFVDLAVRFKRYQPLLSNKLVTQSTEELISQLKFELISAISELNKWQSAHVSLAFVGQVVIQWMQEQLTYLGSHIESTDSENVPTLELLEEKVKTISKSSMVVIQNIVGTTSEEITTEADNWFVKSQTRLGNYPRQLHQQKMIDLIREVIHIVANISFKSPENSSKAIALIGTLVPFFKEYKVLCDLIQNKLLHAMNRNNKTFYILMGALNSISTNGFCTPQEESKDDNTETTSNGTGLGDGAGDANSKEDIDQDEGLTEDAQTENKEQEKDDARDENEEDNAVEMEGDMAGELEDASDQEKSDDEEDDKEDEEMDEEVGDVDDLDPNAIDEKMWDEEGDDNNKEKESDKVPENNNQDNLQANEDDGEANEDNENQDGKDGEESKEGDEENEEEEEEDDAAEQDDAVKHDEGEQLEDNIPESEVLDLPEEINLDGDDGKEEENDQDDEMEDVNMDDAMDVDTEDKKKEDEKNDEEEGAMSEVEGEEDKDHPEADKENNEMEVDGDEGDEEREEEGEKDEDGTTEKDIMEENEENEDNESGKPQQNEMENNMEGLDGPDQSVDDQTANEENAVSQDASANKGEGSNYQTEEEQDNLENNGGASSSKPEENNSEDKEEETVNDEARKNVEESMKQLGDALKEYYDRKKDIKEASDDQQQESEDTSGANQNPDEFEHVDGESSAHETQALGSASHDHRQRIDETKAIEEEEQEDVAAEENREVQDEEMPDTHDEEAPTGEQNTDMSSHAQSMVGERMRQDDDEEGGAEALHEVQDDEDVEMRDPDDPLYDGAEPGFEPARTIEEARELWQTNETVVQESALALTEQLRLILEPTQATKLRGDFKTGKRLNMKRIIPYIASQFKKDKIWMRRTKPSKRQYQIMIAVDDSKSMAESQAARLAFQSIALISKALTQLEAGQLAIARFGESTQVVHPFERPFSSDSGAHVLQWFGFEQTKTDVKQLVQKSIGLFEEAEARGFQSGGGEQWRLEIIISDGMCESHEALRRLVRKAREERIMVVFVVVDGLNNQGSILEMKDVQYDGETGEMKIERYLDHFPFEYYIIVKEIRELPNVLSLVLRQFFSEVAELS
ncbi:uncharacterized protein SAPINGB_P005514 [Magnusiomyces paraingens]|uniref:Midasin n=1 Tax=Magnusiomyces paraingens TaxID=2606893 RepID=A0A5E8C258_9ASCO|nr:uncharacterized protein SAPINGB_P005514 [Saprochaete ingens]VVT57060.1 unnamed protein product [Saprochaete ingens]